MSMKWSYGITTVPSRLETTLPKTLSSLGRAGFDNPILFLDGDSDRVEGLRAFGYDTTVRTPPVRAYGNWVLAAWELILREPQADRYAIFQDDIIACKNVRQYLEKIPFPKQGYLNLITYPTGTEIPEGFSVAKNHGRGAQGLVFDLDGMYKLLATANTVNKPQCKKRGHKNIDGCIYVSMDNNGYKEYIHNPSFLFHIGEESVIGNSRQNDSELFLGEDFDALELLCEKSETA